MTNNTDSPQPIEVPLSEATALKRLAELRQWLSQLETEHRHYTRMNAGNGVLSALTQINKTRADIESWEQTLKDIDNEQ